MSETSDKKPRPPFRVSLLTGTIVILLATALLSVLFGPMCMRRHPPIQVHLACTKNLHELGLYLLMYAEDNEGRYPSPERWCDLLVAKYGEDEDFKNLLRCPGADAGPCNYAMNPMPTRIAMGR
jgi:hypothetical protein